MLPSTPCRGPVGPRRTLVHALALLLVTIALLAPTEAPPRPADSSPSHLVRSSAGSTASVAHGTGAGGPILPRGSGVAQVADPTGQPDVQATTSLPAAVQVTFATTFYDVEGTDIRTLLALLRQRGPSDGQGTWVASTSWVFRWSYQPILESACRVQSAHVNLELAYTCPQWSAAANDLAHALEALPGQSSCDALADAARATAADLLARHAQAQAAYDRETGHGATQGAVLRQESGVRIQEGFEIS